MDAYAGVLDVDPDSPTYAEVVHETTMTSRDDELHHFGWNRCSSACHGPDRSHLIVPGFRSSRIHVLNVADDPRRGESGKRNIFRAGRVQGMHQFFAGFAKREPAP